MAIARRPDPARAMVVTPEGEPARLSTAALRAALVTLRSGCIDLRALSSELGGGVVGEFEQRFATAVGARNGVACSSGTSALLTGLMACGVRPGDEVVVLDEDAVGEVEAMVVTAADAHGVPLQSAQAGGGLAGIDDAGVETVDCIDEAAGEAGGAGETLQHVQGDALAGEDGREGAFDLGDDAAVFQRRAVL